MMNLDEYIEAQASPENEVLDFITHDTYTEVLNPRMVSGKVEGRLLSMIAKMLQPSRILELGTFTGYSAFCLAEGLTENGKLITIEKNDELESRIRRNLSLSPLGEKIDLIIGDAKEIINYQLSTINSFDLVFIDADKREYCAYFDLVLPLVRKDGIILADNTLWDGHILDPAYQKDKQTQGILQFNEKVKNDPRVEQVLLPLRDGLTIIRKL